MSRRRSMGRLTHQPARWVTYDDTPAYETDGSSAYAPDRPAIPWWYATQMPPPWDQWLWHQWTSAWADILLTVCDNVWRNQGAKLYAARRNQPLKDDLEDWLIVKAIENAGRFQPDPWHPAPERQFAAFLYPTLRIQARRHFGEVVGPSDGPSGRAAQEAYNSGIASIEGLDEFEATEGIHVPRHPLHGESFIYGRDPASVIIRIEDLARQIEQIEREDRRAGVFHTSTGAICIINLCTRPAASRTHGLCLVHRRAEQELWAVERGYGCNIPGCMDAHVGRGLCNRHYRQAQSGILPEKYSQYVEQEARRRGPRPSEDSCLEDGCEARVDVRGRCALHHGRWVTATAAPCSIEGCTNKSRGHHGLCTRHRKEQRKQGAPSEKGHPLDESPTPLDETTPPRQEGRPPS